MPWETIFIVASPCLVLIAIFLIRQHMTATQKELLLSNERLQQITTQKSQIDELLKEQQTAQQTAREAFDQHQIKSLKLIQESMQTGSADMRRQITEMVNQNTQRMTEQMEKLTQTTQQKLKDISKEVNEQLTSGFEKTTTTFTDVVKRLAIIDEAQKKITELSSNVVGLQEILSDKRSRGAFGEVQLSALIRNMLPEKHFSLQHTLSNGKRADCLLFLPEPTGNIVIDAKFPLESYRKLQDTKLGDADKKQAQQQFRIDIKKHIQDIADKYIIANETTDGAMMFIPAEAVFAEIHGHYEELVEYAHKQHIWLVSPTTMMAILTTARAVLKDSATRKQVHIIQEHLGALGKDFDRFQKRMDTLAKHVNKAHEDVELVHKSSQKISNRFQKIETVELSSDKEEAALENMSVSE